MQTLSYILFQIDEARSHVMDGRQEHLRLALLLLDNASEVQMERCVSDELAMSEVFERIREKALEIPANERPPDLEELVNSKPLTKKQKFSLSRFFDDKVDFLVARRSLDGSIAQALKHLHRYRNEAYHSATIRPETIRTACIVLIEINCYLLVSLKPGFSYSSWGDYSWFEDRFGKKASWLLRDEDLQTIVHELRSDLLPTATTVSRALADHLASRLTGLVKELDSIAAYLPSAGTRQLALKFAQYFESDHNKPTFLHPERFERFTAEFSLQDIESLELQVRRVRSRRTRIAAFQAFSAIEERLERIERPVSTVSREIDREIQHQIDVMRGK